MVLDVMFLEVFEFTLSLADWSRCSAAWSQEEALRAGMECVGIELIDYGSYVVRPLSAPAPRGSTRLIIAYSKAYRERAEREAAGR